MKKIFLIITAAGMALSLNAQQKPASSTSKPASSSSKPATTSTKLTKADANIIISYNNSIRDFLGGEGKYFKSELFGLFYDLAMDNLNNSNGTQPAKNGNPVTERGGNFEESYRIFLLDINNNRKDLLDIFSPPAQLKSANVTFFKTNLEELRTTSKACYEQYVVCANYFKNYFILKEKSKKKEAIEQLELMVPLVKKIYEIEDLLFDKIDEMGDMAEEVTLAEHPMKKEIFDMRKALKINYKIQAIVQESTPEELETNFGKLETLSNELNAIYTKYIKYESTKGPGSDAMRIAVSAVFNHDGAATLIKLLPVVKEKYKDPAELKKLRSSINRAGVVMDDNYGRFINANNSGY